MNKKLIFTVTSGRSGTGFLAKILDLHSDVNCYHEPTPTFEKVFRLVQEDSEYAIKFWLNEKFPIIEKETNQIYIETSHLICKGFLESLFKIGIIPDIILLKRPAREIAKSLFQLNTIPGRTKKGEKYYLSPKDKNVFLPLPNFNSFNDYQLCFWYALEINKRQKVYKTIVNNIGGKVYEISLNELKSLNSINSMVKNLGLRKFNFFEKIKLKKIINTKINTKSEQKNELPFSPKELFQLEEEVYNETKFLKSLG